MTDGSDFVIAVCIFTFVVSSFVLYAHWASKPENRKRMEEQLRLAKEKSKNLDREYEEQMKKLRNK